MHQDAPRNSGFSQSSDITRRRTRHTSRALRTRSKGKSGRMWLLVLAAVVLTTLGLLSTGALAAGALLFFTKDLPSPDAVVKRDVFQSTLIFDRNGELLYEIWDPQGGRRQVVPLSEMPGYLVAATLATEDANFYTNPGFDLKSMIRAAVQNFLGQEIVSGASTITQQLIRNTMMDPKERYAPSYERKLKEIVLAYRLSQKYTKDQILEWYLNEIYYGNLAYGVEAAAQSYFGKPAKELDLAESAMLAGLPQAPSDYNPLINLKAAKERQAEVLDLMVYHGYINAQEAAKAKAEPLKFVTKQADIKAPHFVMYVRELLEKEFGREKLYYGGLRVYTSLDYNMYLALKKAARDHIAEIKKQNANNAAAVTIDPKTGEILAMLGSVDYNDPKISGQINMALAERQPGSALKPFTYADAFANGLYPATVVIDQPWEFPGGAGQPPYRPMNYDNRWHGPVTLRQALAQSLNIPAVLVLESVGIKNLLNTLHEVGITSLNDENRYGLSLTLGGGEVKLLDLTFAYATLANGGVQVGEKVPDSELKPGFSEYRPVAILKVVDSDGNVLKDYKPPPGKQIISPQIAWLITDILSDDEARAPTYGRNSVLKLSRPAAAKTGTTDDNRDSWTMGYTPDLVTGVWVGNDDDTPMRNVFGASGAGYIWHYAMEEMLKDKPVSIFEQPSGIVRATVYAMVGQQPYKYIPVTDWFIEGTVPQSRPNGWTTPITSTVDITGSLGMSTTWPFTPLLRDMPSAPTPSPTPWWGWTSAPRSAVPAPFATPEPGANIVTVPSVVGMPEEIARDMIDAAGLNNTYPNYQGEGDVPPQVLRSVAPGSVLSQTPQPGTKVVRGTTVYLAIRKKQ